MSSGNAILMLGLNSFSGSVTAKKFLEKGFNVFGLNRSMEIQPLYRAYSSADNGHNIEIMELGSNFEVERVIEICESHKVETIVNFAAQSMVAQSWDTPWDWYETNCVWLSKLSSALIKWGKLKKFIHYTTPEVYGTTSGWISENTPINPSTPYAISRAAGDLHLMAEHKRSRFPVIFTRAANVFGPFQQRYRIIPKALISAASDSEIELHGGGYSERSFIFMNDVASALLSIMRAGQIGSTYHISTTRLVTVRRVVEMCFEVYGKNPEPFIKGAKERPGKDQAYMLDSSKLKSDLGWKDVTSLEEGISLTKDWVDSWISDLLEQPSEYIHQP
jgi:dTDP-glucose 4,6-dehydratase